MYRIIHPTHFQGASDVYATKRDALAAFVAAGCPTDHVNGRAAGAWITDIAGEESTIVLFPALPDRFAGMTRAEMRAAYDAGLRPWSYVEYWTAAISG